MTDIVQSIALFLRAYPDIKWLMVLAGVTLLGISLYKLSVTQTTGVNGRVTTRFRMPLSWPESLNKYLTLERRSYKPWQMSLMRTLYAGQELLFGVLTFVFGLIMLSLGVSHALDSVQTFFRLWPICVTLFGLLCMGSGVVIVIFRDRHNPFTDPDERAPK